MNTSSFPLWHDDLALIDSVVATEIAQTFQKLDGFSEKISRVGADFSNPNRYQDLKSEPLAEIKVPSEPIKKKGWFSSLRRKSVDKQEEVALTENRLLSEHERLAQHAQWAEQANLNIVELNSMVEEFHEMPKLLIKGLRDCRKLSMDHAEIMKKEQGIFEKMSLSDPRAHRLQRQKLKGLERAQETLTAIYQRFTHAQSNMGKSMSELLDEWLNIEKENLLRFQFQVLEPEKANSIEKMSMPQLHQKHFELILSKTESFLGRITEQVWEDFINLDPTPEDMAALPISHVANILFEYCSNVKNKYHRAMPEEKMDALLSKLSDDQWEDLRNYEQSNYRRQLPEIVEDWVLMFEELIKVGMPVSDVGLFATLMERFPSNNPSHRMKKWMDALSIWREEEPPKNYEKVLNALSSPGSSFHMFTGVQLGLGDSLLVPTLKFVLENPSRNINAELILNVLNSSVSSERITEIWEELRSINVAPEGQNRFLNSSQSLWFNKWIQSLVASNIWDLSESKAGQELLHYQHLKNNPDLPLNVEQFRALNNNVFIRKELLKSRTGLVVKNPEEFDLHEFESFSIQNVIALAEANPGLLTKEWGGETLLHYAWHCWVPSYESSPSGFVEALPHFQALMEMGADPFQKTQEGDFLDVLARDYVHMNRSYVGPLLAGECARIGWFPFKEIADRFDCEMPDMLVNAIESCQKMKWTPTRCASKLWKGLEKEQFGENLLELTVYALPRHETSEGDYARKVIAQISIKAGLDPKVILDRVVNEELEKDMEEDKDVDLLLKKKMELKNLDNQFDYEQTRSLMNKIRF